MSNKIAVRCVELGIEFESMGDASRTFGNYDSTSNISNCIKGVTKTAYGYHWVSVKPIKRKRQDKKNKNPSLCWKCYRSAHFTKFPCPWAVRFEPVEGWEAEEIFRNESGVKVHTYHITKCPLFMADDERRTENE